MVQDMILLVVLAVTAYRDVKEQKVYVYVPLIAGITGVVCHMWYRVPTLPDMIGGMAIGVGLLVFAWVSRESIGTGDGLMLMVSGSFLGFKENVALLFTAIAMAGITALFLLTVKRKGKNYRMPFLPFLFAAYLVLLL